MLRHAQATGSRASVSSASAFWHLSDAIPTVMAIVLMALGVLVMTGWILRIPALTQVVPGFTSMVFNTAAAFALTGGALLLTRRQPQPVGLLARGMALSVGLLAALNLFQIASGAPVGINQPWLHGWMKDGNPVPGQMSTPTSVCFFLASLAFAAVHGAWPETARRLVGRTATALVFSIASVALVGYLMRLEALFSWYAFSRMAVHTALGMVALSVALWCRQSSMEHLRSSNPEGRILALGTWTLILIASITGLSGFFMMKAEVDRDRAETLRLTHQARVEALDITLQLRSTRGQLAASRLIDHDLLAPASAEPADHAPASIGTLLEGLRPHGFSSILLAGVDGSTLDGIPSNSTPQLSVILNAPSGEVRRLEWDRGFVLHQRFEIRRENQLLGYIQTEQPLTQLDRLLTPAPSNGAAQTELCGRTDIALRCFPNVGHAQPYSPSASGRNELAPLGAAQLGRSGSMTYRDPEGSTHLAVFGAVADHGLVVATTLDSALAFAPLRARLKVGGIVLFLVTAMGVWILRGSIRPLAQALSQAEERYRTVVDNLQEGVIVQGSGSSVLAANPASARILGVAPDEVLRELSTGTRFRVVDEAGHEVATRDQPGIKALLTGRGERDAVRGLIDAEGRLRWLLVSSVRVSHRDGPAAIVTFEDITERRLARQRLEESEARYQLMVDQVTDSAILMLDLEGRVTSWNRGAERITGYTATEMIGQYFGRFLPEEDRIDGQPARELLAAREASFTCEGWRVRKNGSRFWASIAISAVKDSQGAVLGYAKLIRDLTEQHRAEREVAEARRRVQAMIDASPFGIVATDLDGTILHMNPAGARMTGYAPAELVGKLTPAVYHDPEEIRLRARELSEETGKAIEPGIDTFVYKARLGLKDEREWTCVRKDGTRFPICAAITALRDPDDRVVGYLGVAYDITERRRLEDYTRHVANHDYLTGLPMRRLLDDRLLIALSKAQRDCSRLALLMIDLDHFKRINDSLGHHVGDELLKEVARRLQGCVRGCDTVARMGGDEFVVLLADVSNLAGAERIASLIVERLSVPVLLGSHELHVTPSVGVAMFPDDAQDPASLLKRADTAMYAAKLAGRGCYRTFSKQMQQEADHRLMLENDLRLALQRSQLALHYQPQVCLDTGRVIGMEALMRWEHPTMGTISPDQFISIAEESDLILELGEWAMRNACLSAKRLQDSTGVRLRMAVNLSARQFRSPKLSRCIADALHRSGLSPEDLEVEITETLLMDDADQAIQRLVEIKGLGCDISVDDFGTGYSSLAYVTRFPIDTLKIDRSFVSRLPGSTNDEAVAQAIIALAQSLKIRVVAEGVENAAQLGFLRARRCGAAQGFLFGCAVPAEQFSVQGFHIGRAIGEPEPGERSALIQKTATEIVIPE